MKNETVKTSQTNEDGTGLTQLEELLSDHQPFHSNFQIDHFIIRKSAPTAFGQYVQVLRELDARVEELKSAYVRIEKQKIECSSLESAIPRSKSREIHALDILEANRKLDHEETMQTDRFREFARLYSIAVQLKEEVGELTQERRDKLDAENWETVLAERFVFQIQNNARDFDLSETVISLPDAMAKRIIAAAKSGDVHERFSLPEVRPAVTEEQVKGFICR